ncbi:hypothetical protein [Haloferula helveola]|uniref:hypothetical protein n=1 Tax=Haloferula helveola TaxID=490095 RepID=UPI0030CBD711
MLPFLLGGVLSASVTGAGTGSSLVYPGPGGQLEYAGYANEGQASTGNRMIDFSMAGYRGGGVAIPWVPVEIELDPVPGGGDDHARIQAAIDTLSAMPLSPAGFRGTLLLKAGNYNVSETLHINASGVVIRGEGQGSGGTVIHFTATAQDDLFEFTGSSRWTKVSAGETTIADPLVPSGVRSFGVVSAAGFSVGDRIIINRTPNQAWIDLLDMAQWGWTTGAYTSDLPRVITAIDGNTITVDAPLTHAIESQYGGAEVYRYTFDGAIRNVGIEGLRIESAYTSDTDEDHGWSAVMFRKVENAWARNITANYFGYACVDIRDDSLFVTVEDCAQLDPKSQITGSRRYSFRIDDSSFILFQRCYTEKGRHDYVTQSNTAGPNVFVDSLAEITYSDIGPHHRYSEGILFDNIKGGPTNVQNRKSSGTGHGWAGAQTVFWNCEASSIICDAPKAAMNFAIGCVGTKSESNMSPEEPFGFWESEQVPVTPRSLYYTQLMDRLGEPAVRTVITPSQLDGRIWSELSSWHGDGAPPGLPPLAPVQVDLGNDRTETETSLPVIAVVRCPLPDNFPMTVTGWTQTSGPAGVTFDDPGAASTVAQFPGPGTYELSYSVSQDDNRDPGDVVTYPGSDSVMITIVPPPDAVGTLASTDSIVGEGQAAAPSADYYPDDGSTTVGTSGSTLTDTRVDRNVVLGFTLPTLPVGESIESVDLLFEITGARDQTGAANLPDLRVDLLDTADPDATGASFFHHGPSDPTQAHVGATAVTISGTSQNSFADDAEDRTFEITGAALTLLQGFYGGDHIPDQPEAFFRFSLSEDPDLADLRRYAIDFGAEESRLEFFTGSPDGTFGSWIAGYPEVGAETEVDDDPDGDGNGNGLENYFGTHPGEFSSGLVAGTPSGNTFTFSHPLNPTPASDLTASYRWSKDLSIFTPDGVAHEGTTVTFSQGTPAGGFVTVTATVTGAPTDRLFLVIEATAD